MAELDVNQGPGPKPGADPVTWVLPFIIYGALFPEPLALGKRGTLSV